MEKVGQIDRKEIHSLFLWAIKNHFQCVKFWGHVLVVFSRSTNFYDFMFILHKIVWKITGPQTSASPPPPPLSSGGLKDPRRDPAPDACGGFSSWNHITVDFQFQIKYLLISWTCWNVNINGGWFFYMKYVKKLWIYFKRCEVWWKVSKQNYMYNFDFFCCKFVQQLFFLAELLSHFKSIPFKSNKLKCWRNASEFLPFFVVLHFAQMNGCVFFKKKKRQL